MSDLEWFSHNYFEPLILLCVAIAGQTEGVWRHYSVPQAMWWNQWYWWEDTRNWCISKGTWGGRLWWVGLPLKIMLWSLLTYSKCNDMKKDAERLHKEVNSVKEYSHIVMFVM